MIKSLCYLLIVIYAGFVVAQQSDDQQTEKTTDKSTNSDVQSQAEEKQSDITADKEKLPEPEESKNETTPTVFNPTEEISEDSPVPFPVDI